ncbi:glycosyltransferase domain-containing protein, partial [Oceanisphaera marina]|uniref:glycosyltransferase domain-containing protein n=1 Tax=Oceanisphaera marina TaxID=2017550 RepID=UPI001E490ABF
IERYQSEGYPKGYGLNEMNVIFRVHNEVIRLLMEEWWQELLSGAKRDQISFRYVCWKHKVSVGEVEISPRRENKFYKIVPHSSESIGLKNKVLFNILYRKHSSSFFYLLSRCVEFNSKLKGRFKWKKR